MVTGREGIAKVAPWYDPDISHEYATLNGRRYRKSSLYHD